MTAWLDSLGQSQQLMQNDVKKSLLFAFRKTFQGFRFSFKPDQVIGLKTFLFRLFQKIFKKESFFCCKASSLSFHFMLIFFIQGDVFRLQDVDVEEYWTN